MKELFRPNCIRTFSGQYVNLLSPDPDTILIEDIAHALAGENRWGNHLPEPYSVAQHLILCAEEASTKHKLDALMHDAGEYLLRDLGKPAKDLCPDYKIVEERLMKVISAKFGFEYPKPLEVSRIDNWMLEREWYDLILNQQYYGHPRIIPMSFQRAKATFLDVFSQYSLQLCSK